ncbi:ABC transporter permease [Actinacidiphila alni]|uniref:ABC transporter permease n=1 Tax=Actinacidiphila alni TaxID=380248 RepID=UPI0033E4EF14
MRKTAPKGLAHHLLHTGHEAGRRAEAARTRFAALTVATLVLAVCLGALAFVHAAYTGKESRREARTPVRQTQETAARRSTLWLVGSDALKGQRRFSVVDISPATADAPLPPGVDHWPAPGEAVLSPGLLKAGAHEGIATRYGKLAGVIADDGLEDPGEWLAYVRPATPMKAERPIEPVIGFGPTAGQPADGLEPGSARTDDKPEWMFQALVSGLLIIPSLVLLFVAVRAGTENRERRGGLLDALGGRRRDRALLALGETARPALLGALASVPLIASAMVLDVRIPYVGYAVASADLRRHGLVALLAPLAALLLALGSVVLVDQIPGRMQANRPHRTGRAHWQRRIALLCPVAILVAARGPELVDANPTYHVWTVWTGLAAVVLTTPAAVAAVVAELGRLLERKGRERGWAGALVAGRRLSHDPAATTRLVAGVIVALIVFGQAVAWQGLFGAYNSQLEKALGSAATNIAEIGPKGPVTAGDMDSYLRRLPAGSAPVMLTGPADPTRNPMVVRGDCPALRSLALPCPRTGARVDRITDHRLQELIRWNAAGGTFLEVLRTDRTDIAQKSAFDDGSSTLAILDVAGGGPPVPALKELSYRVLPRGAQVRFPGEEWLSNAAPDRDQGRWVRLCGVAGVGFLVLAVGLSGMVEFLRHGRALAPLTVLTGGYRVFRSSAAWAISAPLAVAGLLGAVITSWLARPIAMPGSTTYIPMGLMASATAVVLAVSALFGLWAAHIAREQARDWHV